MSKQKRFIAAIVAGILALAMIVSLIASLAYSVSAASSSSIQSQIDALEQQQENISSQRTELENSISANQSKTQDLVSQKAALDQQIELTQEEIDNQTELIQQYNLLIAEKQGELDESLAQQQELNEKYHERLRAMEENGNVSYWSILFKASSFSDLLDRIYMIREIASSDQEMMQQLQDIAKQIESERSDLDAQRTAQEAVQAQLTETQASLESQRSESDTLINQLLSDTAAMQKLYDDYESQEAALLNQIAAKEQEYTQAVAAEQAAAAAAQQQQENGGGSSGDGGSPGNGTSTNAPASSGFLYPLPAGSAYVSCAYGPRTHPVTGNYSFHNGVDLAAPGGTPIYATKSGTVTTATYNSVYGYYVTINHGDGFSSLYGHMTRYVVSAGQTVTQGQVIGYVGTTGLSTGNHLHFTIFYNGSTVNPMGYI